jgi:hypothetical protein
VVKSQLRVVRKAKRTSKAREAPAGDAAGPATAAAKPEGGHERGSTRFNGKTMCCCVEDILRAKGNEGATVTEVMKALEELVAGGEVNIGSLRNTLCQQKKKFVRIGPGKWALLELVGEAAEVKAPLRGRQAAAAKRKREEEEAAEEEEADEAEDGLEELAEAGGAEPAAVVGGESDDAAAML